MLIPEVQLVVVSADYKVPVLLRERLLTGKYQDAYMDLSTATDGDGRLTIEDIQADGLAFRPAKGVSAGESSCAAARKCVSTGSGARSG